MLKTSKLLLVLLVFFVSFASSYSYAQVKALFSPRGGAHRELIKHIDKADRNIDIAIYSFSSSRILKALNRAFKRGVKIRMIYDDAGNAIPKNPGDKTKAQWSAEYERNGIDVRYVTNKKIMHNKFIIIDGFPDDLVRDPDFSNTILMNSSGNFSNGADSRYNENWVFVQNKPWVISTFQREFQKLWMGSYDFPSGSKFNQWMRVGYRLDSRYKPSKTIIPYFTSRNFGPGIAFRTLKGSRIASKSLAKAISRAKKSIYVATGHFRLMALANALIKAKEKAKKEGRSLDIRVLSDSQEHISPSRYRREMKRYQACIKRSGQGSERCEMAGGYHASRYLFEHGINMRLKYYAYIWHYPYEPQMHHKYMIIDGNEVWSGSYNWSRNAEYNTFETLVQYRGKEMQGVVKSFVRDFMKLWTQNRNRFDAHKRKIRNSNRFPIHFGGKYGRRFGQGPMGLSIGEIDELLDVIRGESPNFFKKAKADDLYWNKATEKGEK